MTESSGAIINASGDLAIGGDVVGRDKIIHNIQNIVQRALTAAEAAHTDRELERQALAAGVSAFARSLQARAGEDTVTRGNPYKGLLTYRLSDTSLFFGRTRAINDVLDRLSRAPLTVIHSESGAGKSSLLQAGVMPQLIARGHLPIYLRPYQVEPYLAIKRAFLPDLGVAPLLATGPLRDFLRQTGAILGPDCRLYIFLDQAEELFTQLPDPARAEFVRELAECLEDDSLNVRWTLALRTEFFGALANFRPQIRDPFANDYRLNRLTLAEAHEVVAEPAKRRGVLYEAGLVEQIIKDLGAAEVSPPEIQIVCSGLYTDLPPAETVTLRTITRALYEQGGGAAGLLHDHLDRVLTRDVPKDLQTAARRLLEALISSEGRRIIRSHSALVQELTSLGVAAEKFDALAGQLIDSRLLRRLEPNAEHPEPGYELAHDYLIGKITVDPAVQARKAAQELLERETDTYQRFGRRTLLDDDKLAILEPRLTELTLSPESKLLLEKSRTAQRRRRGFQMGSLVVTGLLLVAGVVFGFITISAQNSLRDAGTAVAAAQVQATAASRALFEADVRAAEAGAQVGTSVAVADRAARLRSTAVVEVTQASDEAAAIRLEAADIRRQAAAAERVVRGLFEKNQLVPVDVGPAAMLLAGDQLWVANAISNTVQTIDPQTGAAGSPIPVGRNPTALLFDGRRVWVANTEDNTIQAFDPVTRAEVVAPIATGRSPLGLAWDGQRVWVSNGDDDAVQAIDPEQRVVIATVPVGDRPYALAFDGQKLWVGNWSDSTLMVIDPATQQVEPGTLTVGSRPAALLFDGQRLWTVNQNDRVAHVSVIDVARRVVLNSGQPITVGLNPVALAYDPTGQQVWVSVQNEDGIRAVDPATFRVGALVKVGRLPSGLVSAAGRLWVANNGNNTVQVVDPRLGDLSATLPVGPAPRALLFLPNRNQLWLSYQTNQTLQALDVAANRLGTRYLVGNEPRSLAFDGTRLWVANGRDNTVQSVNLSANVINAPVAVGPSVRSVAFDGVRIWVVNGRGGPNNTGTLQPIDPDTRRPGTAIPIGVNPTALFFDGARLWVANSTDNTVQSVAPTSGLLGPAIPVGNFPNAFTWDGARLWVANQNSNTVQAIDPLRNTVTLTVTVNTAPIDLAFDGQQVWVASFTGKTVQSIEPATGAVGPPIPVDSRPRALAFDGTRLWIANQDNDNLQYLTIHK